MPSTGSIRFLRRSRTVKDCPQRRLAIDEQPRRTVAVNEEDVDVPVGIDISERGASARLHLVQHRCSNLLKSQHLAGRGTIYQRNSEVWAPQPRSIVGAVLKGLALIAEELVTVTV